MAIHEKVVSKVGYFYEPYFLYYEDADYCLRAAKAGFPIVKIELPDISHEETATLGKGSRAHQYYMARNHMLFVSLHAPRAVKIFETIRFPKTLSDHIMKHEKGALMGVRDFMFRRFGMLQRRGA